MTSVYKEKLYPSLEEVDLGGSRKHSRGKENAPVLPLKKKAKFHGTPLKAPADSAVAALQTQIEREYKIRDGATRLLQASKNTRHSMDASKGMFVSNAKILALMREMQQRKATSTDQTETSDNELKPCKSRIGISDIRIPLEWREFDLPKGKSDSNTHYGVFCLFKIGNQVMDSSSLVEVDRTTMDIMFKDTVIFPESVDPDFTLEVEVYCSVPVEENSGKPSTPIKMLKRLRSRPQDKVNGSPAPIAATSNVPSSPYTPSAPVVSPSHRFVLAGHAHLTIDDVSNSCRTYVLKRGSVGASGTASTGNETTLLPLWGQICCNLMAQPDCATEVRRSGFINMQRMVSGLPDWTRLWSVVRQNHFRCWMSPEDVGRKMPTYHFDLTKTMSVEPAPRLSIRRPNTLLVRDSKNEFFMAFESKEERTEWMETINQAILDFKVWQSSCEFTIPIPQSKFYTESPTKQHKDFEFESKSETTI